MLCQRPLFLFFWPHAIHTHRRWGLITNHPIHTYIQVHTQGQQTHTHMNRRVLPRYVPFVLHYTASFVCDILCNATQPTPPPLCVTHPVPCTPCHVGLEPPSSGRRCDYHPRPFLGRSSSLYHLPRPPSSMVTHWKTDPIMDNPLTRPSAHHLSRPQVFVKVEFGVSWSAQHAPRKHGLEYKSRALRERAAQFPRHVPAPTTNYLVAPSEPPHHFNNHPTQDYHRAVSRLHNNNTNTNLDHNREPYPEQHAAQQNLLPPESMFSQGTRSRQVNFAPEPDVRYPTVPRRRSRATIRSPSLERHDRGHSAPPPLSDNNWDVVQSPSTAQAATGSMAASATTPRPRSDVWKDLPEVPSKFRLGEDGMPWDGTWTFPMGWEPFLEPDPYLQPSSSHGSPNTPQSPPAQARPQSRSGELPNSPTVVNIESPVDSPRLLQQDPSRRSDLEALGSAMMTVDNGFENQWWNQGQREVMPVAMHPPPPTGEQAQEQMALGWVGALLPPGSDNPSFPLGSPEPTIVSPGHSKEPSFSNMVVSPVSSYSGPVSGLNRALSTRSDELWFSSSRFA